MSVDQCTSDDKLGDSCPLEAPSPGSYDDDSVDVEVKLAEPGCLRRGTGRPARRGRPPRSSPPSAMSQLRKRMCVLYASMAVVSSFAIAGDVRKLITWPALSALKRSLDQGLSGIAYVVVRGNKGFCRICMKTVLLFENPVKANTEKVQVDFDDQSSWEYLFKIYWVSLKEKLFLSLDELAKAENPMKSAPPTASKRRPETRRLYRNISLSRDSCGDVKARHAKIGKTESIHGNNADSLHDRLLPLPCRTAWATDELLEFVGCMQDGGTSVLSKYDVQSLILEHVRRNNLQDPRQKCQIVCDSELIRLFGKERVDHVEMLKLLDSHFFSQEMSPVTDSSSNAGVAEVVSIQTWADRSCDRQNRSERQQGRETKQLNTQNNRVGPSTSDGRNQAVIQTEVSPLDAKRVWLYQDRNGKIQGPFSVLNLRQWNFPPELRIWRSGEKQDDSVLLSCVLNGEFDKTGPSQNRSVPVEEVTDISNDGNGSVDIVRGDDRRSDVSPNSVSTDQSMVSSSTSNKSLPSDFALSGERQAMGSVPLWNRPEDDGPLLGQSQISCSLSLSTFPGDSNTNSWNGCCQNGIGLHCRNMTQVAATLSSASTAWDSNFQEIDFLDLFSPTFKPSLASASASASMDWQPIMADPNECDESVLDLLAQMEAMESQKDLLSPSSSARGHGGLTRRSVNDCFGLTEGLCPVFDVSKGDAMSSTSDLQMDYGSNTMDY